MDAPEILRARVAECDAVLYELRDRGGAREREITKVLLYKAGALAQLGARAEAIAVLDDVVHSPAVDGDLEVRVAAAWALLLQIELSEGIENPASPVERLEAVDDFLAHVSSDPEPRLRAPIAALLIEKALLLERAGRSADVPPVLDELVTRFGDSQEPRIAQSAAWALRNRVSLLLDGHRDEEALAAADQLLVLFARQPSGPRAGEIDEHVLEVGKLLMTHNHTEAAAPFLMLPFDRDLRDAEAETRFQSARLQLNTFIAASRVGDRPAAIHAMDELHGMGEAALAAIDEAVDRLEATSAGPEDLAAVLVNKIPILYRLDREQDARQAFSDFIERSGNDSSPVVEELITALREELDLNDQN